MAAAGPGLTVWLVALLACADPVPVAPDPAPDAPGPYDPGVTTIEVPTDDGRTLTVEVWYPAHADPGAEPDPYPEIPLSIGAFRNADPATEDAPYRLVAFTHGHIAIRYQSAFLTEHLASHGFVVVAPDHPGDTLLDADPDALWDAVVHRPGDLIASVDAVQERAGTGDPLLGGLVLDPTYAVMGHSLGSITALSVGGGQVDFESFVAFCEAAEAAGEDWEGCGRVADPDPADVVGVPLTDPRAIATLPMSPGLWYAFGPDGSGLSGVRNPLVLAGDQTTCSPTTPRSARCGPPWGRPPASRPSTPRATTRSATSACSSRCGTSAVARTTATSTWTSPRTSRAAWSPRGSRPSSAVKTPAARGSTTRCRAGPW